MPKSNTIPERYHRQVLLKELGESGQYLLGAASVLMLGAGGLGCPALQYLAAAGVGTIGIVDFDRVSMSNLHRQVLYGTEDIGQLKVLVAEKKLKAINPEISIQTYPVKLDNRTCLELFGQYDIIIDGTDNFATRYMVNDACVLMQKPLVYGAVSRFEGQVAVFNYPANDNSSVNYRDIFPHPPVEGEVLNCAEAGVLGVLPGIIGSMQANEAIKLITGMGEVLKDQLYTYHALYNQHMTVHLSAVEDNRKLIPKDHEQFLHTNYEWLCGIGTNDMEIDARQFNELMQAGKITIIDVREEGEVPEINTIEHVKMPLSGLKEQLEKIEGDTVLFICQSGKRSLQAAKLLAASNTKTKHIYSLRGGILNWHS
nr:HesA/MoeB/ThiF family protein [Flavihumibacter rivuli]